VVIVVVPSLLAKKKLDKARAQHDAFRVQASEFVLEKVGGARTVLSFGRAELEAVAFGAVADGVAAAEERVAAAEAKFMGTLDLGVKVGLGLIPRGGAGVGRIQVSGGVC
jgi:hypothetical protein